MFDLFNNKLLSVIFLRLFSRSHSKLLKSATSDLFIIILFFFFLHADRNSETRSFLRLPLGLDLSSCLSSIQTLLSRARARARSKPCRAELEQPTQARARAWPKNKRAEPGQPRLAQARLVYTPTRIPACSRS
jgi:hypothetical protein